MVEVLSQTYGRPGNPGRIEVTYETGLSLGCQLNATVGEPGKGGEGGLPSDIAADDEVSEFVDRGGAGGGRENLPIINALVAYAESCEGTEHQPLYFLESGPHEFVWPYETATATIVVIGAGGGGGGGIGDTLPGEDGEDGLSGAIFIFPTYLPVQRQRETEV